MDEQTASSLIFVVYGSFAFVLGYIVGRWRCKKDYEAILKTLIDIVPKGVPGEPETVRKTNRD